MELLLLAAEGTSFSQQFFTAFAHNPTFMVMNACVSAVVLTIVVERLLFQLTRYQVNSREFFAQVRKLVVAGNIDRAIKLCEVEGKMQVYLLLLSIVVLPCAPFSLAFLPSYFRPFRYPILELVKAGLTHSNKSEDEIDAALSEKLSELKPQAEKRIGALWSLANIATLIGLLGTVSGLIQTFGAIGAKDLAQDIKQQLLSNGIAEAMYNTAIGLGIAVICMITHIILHTRAKSIQHDLETTMERTFNLLTLQRGDQA